jgi:hypothetical protein
MRKDGFLPLPVDGFTIPTHWKGEHALLIPAGPEWVELDYNAVIQSREKLKHLFGPKDPWPPEDLSPDMDRADLAWHAKEFDTRRSFAYHLLTHDQQACLGCLYLYPTASSQHDAEAYLWTHIDLRAENGKRIEEEVIHWINTCWPFENIAWPGRLIPFENWERAGIPNYYAMMR